MEEKPRPNRQAPLWALALGFLVMMSVLRLALFLRGPGGVAVLLGGFGLLGIAAMRWGYRSSFSNDWNDFVRWMRRED